MHESLLLALYLTDMNHLNNSTTIYVMSILLFPSNLRLCVPNGLYHLEFMTKIFVQNYNLNISFEFCYYCVGR